VGLGTSRGIGCSPQYTALPSFKVKQDIVRDYTRTLLGRCLGACTAVWCCIVHPVLLGTEHCRHTISSNFEGSAAAESTVGSLWNL